MTLLARRRGQDPPSIFHPDDARIPEVGGPDDRPVKASVGEDPDRTYQRWLEKTNASRVA
jgi:hypothetical protein